MGACRQNCWDLGQRVSGETKHTRQLFFQSPFEAQTVPVGHGSSRNLHFTRQGPLRFEDEIQQMADGTCGTQGFNAAGAVGDHPETPGLFFSHVLPVPGKLGSHKTNGSPFAAAQGPVSMVRHFLNSQSTLTDQGSHRFMNWLFKSHGTRIMHRHRLFHQGLNGRRILPQTFVHRGEVKFPAMLSEDLVAIGAGHHNGSNPAHPQLLFEISEKSFKIFRAAQIMRRLGAAIQHDAQGRPVLPQVLQDLQDPHGPCSR